MTTKGQTIAKFTEKYANEDAVFAYGNCIAVSDGAGGYGVFADEWSGYLINNLPKTEPLTDFQSLDQWLDNIWEDFYNHHEEKAREVDGILLNKFYNEGSCATLVAVWKIDDNQCRWMAYGDSVVFHYNRATQRLEHSFTKLTDFEQSPFLINCKDPLIESKAYFGTFNTDASSVVFVASDALSHYLLMMYELKRCNEYADELIEERNAGTLNSQLLMAAESIHLADYYTDVLKPLIESAESAEKFGNHMQKLHTDGILDIDDYSFACIVYGDQQADNA